jgi:hypothetical protein
MIREIKQVALSLGKIFFVVFEIADHYPLIYLSISSKCLQSKLNLTDDVFTQNEMPIQAYVEMY